jgi:FHA domain
MSQQLRIVCGNPNCKAGLLIQNPEKIKQAKCPVCGFLNAMPTAGAAPVSPPLSAPVIGNDGEAPTVMQRTLPTELGWLIVKDEVTATQTFVLKKGINTIGRLSKARPADVMVDTDDEYVSRPHCTIEVKIGRLGTVEYVLQDGIAQADGTWKNSLNGTYLNGQEPRLSEFDRVYLNDGDTIQVGVTKLVLKSCQLSASLQQAHRQVEDMDYERTVIGFKNQR